MPFPFLEPLIKLPIYLSPLLKVNSPLPLKFPFKKLPIYISLLF